MGHITDRCFI